MNNKKREKGRPLNSIKLALKLCKTKKEPSSYYIVGVHFGLGKKGGCGLPSKGRRERGSRGRAHGKYILTLTFYPHRDYGIIENVRTQELNACFFVC